MTNPTRPSTVLLITLLVALAGTACGNEGDPVISLDDPVEEPTNDPGGSETAEPEPDPIAGPEGEDAQAPEGNDPAAEPGEPTGPEGPFNTHVMTVTMDTCVVRDQGTSSGAECVHPPIDVEARAGSGWLLLKRPDIADGSVGVHGQVDGPMGSMEVQIVTGPERTFALVNTFGPEGMSDWSEIDVTEVDVDGETMVGVDLRSLPQFPPDAIGAYLRAFRSNSADGQVDGAVIDIGALADGEVEAFNESLGLSPTG